MSRLLPVAAALALALFLAMGWYSWMVLTPAAGGLAPFDARIFGYSPVEALDYLRALNGTGRAVYMLEMRWLDRAFPLVFGLALGLGLLLVTAGRFWLLRLALLGVVALGMGADFAENACVQEMLLRGADHFSVRLAEWASLFTRAKFAFAGIALLALAGFGWRARLQIGGAGA